MRLKNPKTPDQLLMLLRQHPGVKASQLAEWLQISQPTLSRLLGAAGEAVLPIGAGSRRCYFGQRTLRGLSGNFPLYAVNTEGQVNPQGVLKLTAPEGSVLDVAALGWPVEAEFADGVWPGLPYVLQDMRPQGFLGRNFARHWAQDLGVSPHPAEWHDDDVLHLLTQRGSDTTGNLILGDVALQRWLQAKAEPLAIISEAQTEQAYAQKADQASALGAVGSSAAGEFPKFTALRALAGSLTPHVIVKFSGAEPSGAVQRWADLLVCEHLALQTLQRSLGVASARSRLLSAGGRTLLEVERFDRHGDFGRSPLCSLETLEAALLGKTSTDWGVLAEMMRSQGWVSTETVQTIRLIWQFGQLIGNTDMHKGNLSFVPGHPMTVAPVYDMLPMLYAPLAGGEVPTPRYQPALPLPQNRDTWLQACTAAQAFWQSASTDARISPAFQQVLRGNLLELERVRGVA
jgi:hypothetical protein